MQKNTIAIFEEAFEKLSKKEKPEPVEGAKQTIESVVTKSAKQAVETTESKEHAELLREKILQKENKIQSLNEEFENKMKNAMQQQKIECDERVEELKSGMNQKFNIILKKRLEALVNKNKRLESDLSEANQTVMRLQTRLGSKFEMV